MYVNKKKLLRYTITAFFTFGAVASIGFLGFTGALLLPIASVPLAIAVFVFSGAIEETVFSKSIYKGLGRLRLIGPKAQRYFLKMGLDYYLTNFIKKNGPDKLKIQDELEKQHKGFLEDYYKQRDYYKELKKNRSNVDKNELIEAKKRLEELRDYFYIQTKQNKSGKVTGDTYIDSTLQLAANDLLYGAKRKWWMLSFASVISLIVGSGAGLVTASAMSSALISLGLGLSVATLSAIVWPVAILAMVGTVFLLYKNMTDFFKEDSVAIEAIKGAWRFIRQLPTVVWQNICQLPTGIKQLLLSIHQSPGKVIKNFFIKLLKIAVSVAVVGLTLFAAIATLCTWNLAVKAGLNLIPGVPLILVMVCCPILVGLNFLTDLTYGFSTSAETIQAFFLIKVSEIISQLWSKFKNLRNTESFLQLINPFRLIVNTINGVFKLSIFSAHVLSVGITTDRLWKLSPTLVAVGCALPEALQDASFFVGKSNEGHDHGGVIMQLLIWGKNLILIALLIPVLDAFWHWASKKKGSDLTLWNALCRSFKRCCDIEEHQHDAIPANTASPQLSEAWREKHRPEFLLSEASKRLDSAVINPKGALEKQACLQELMSEREAIVAFKKETNLTRVIDTEGSLDGYLAKKKAENPPENGHIPNGLSNKSISSNGYANKEKSRCTTLNQRRTWASNRGLFRTKDKSTTTVDLVNDAFSLVAGG